jgi:hypothetical protein
MDGDPDRFNGFNGWLGPRHTKDPAPKNYLCRPEQRRAVQASTLEGRGRTPAVAISTSAAVTADNIGENLWRILRQLNLSRIANDVRGSNFDKAVEVRLSLIRDQSELMAVSRNEKQACKTWNKPLTLAPAKALKTGTKIILTHCDRVQVRPAGAL